MAFVKGFDKLLSLQVTQRFGLPNGFGHVYFGWSEFGDYNDYAGVYAKRTTPNRKGTVKMRHTWPVNPNTEGQQTWRGIFRDGVTAWHNLTTEEKAVYNKDARQYQFEGFNLFMRKWLYEHRT